MIETLPAAVDVEEMIYELKDYCCGANAGRWDYIFSIIKRLQSKPEAVLPDRKQVDKCPVPAICRILTDSFSIVYKQLLDCVFCNVVCVHLDYYDGTVYEGIYGAFG